MHTERGRGLLRTGLQPDIPRGYFAVCLFHQLQIRLPSALSLFLSLLLPPHLSSCLYLWTLPVYLPVYLLTLVLCSSFPLPTLPRHPPSSLWLFPCCLSSGSLPLPITILLLPAPCLPPHDFPRFFLLFPSTSLPLVSPGSPGKSSFPASPPVSQQAATEWSNAGRWGTEHSLLRRGSGLLIRLLWVEEVEASFNYVTSTQPLHPDDAVQPARLSLPGLNGERSPPA